MSDEIVEKSLMLVLSLLGWPENDGNWVCRYSCLVEWNEDGYPTVSLDSPLYVTKKVQCPTGCL